MRCSLVLLAAMAILVGGTAVPTAAWAASEGQKAGMQASGVRKAPVRSQLLSNIVKSDSDAKLNAVRNIRN